MSTSPRRPSLRVWLILAGAFALTPFGLCGQSGPWSAGGSVRATLLVGGTEEFLAGNLGGGVHAMRRWRPGVAVRADASILGLDERGPAGEKADNTLLTLTLGPDLSARAGPVAFYVRPSAGLMVNFRGGTSGAGPAGAGWTHLVGAALGVRVFSGRVSVDAGGDVVRAGRVEFARVSSFTGSTSVETVTALSAHIGLSLHLR